MPTPAWTDTFDDDVVWHTIEFQTMFWDAVNERRLVSLLSEYPLPATGCVLQRAGGGTPASSTGNFSVRTLQDFATNFTSAIWLKPTADFDGLTSSGVPSSMKWTQAEAYTEIGSASGLIRKRPREINSTTATTDTRGNARSIGHKAHLVRQITSLSSTTDSMGNTVVSGMVASLTGTPDSYTIRGASTWSATTSRIHDTMPGIYEFNGTAWVLSTGYPDTISSGGVSGYLLAYGLFETGDYIGGWLYNQIRDLLRLMRRRQFGPFTSSLPASSMPNSGQYGEHRGAYVLNGLSQQVDCIGTDSSSYATAKSACDSLWAGASEGPLLGATVSVNMAYLGVSGAAARNSGGYIVALHAVQGKPRIASYPYGLSYRGINAESKVYIYATSTAPGNPNAVFKSYGLPLTENEYALVETMSVTGVTGSTGIFVSSPIGTSTTKPDHSTQPVNIGDSFSLGFIAGDFTAAPLFIFDYYVSGGFVYQ